MEAPSRSRETLLRAPHAFLLLVLVGVTGLWVEESPSLKTEMGRSDLEIHPRVQAPYLLNPRGVWEGPWGSIWVSV